MVALGSSLLHDISALGAIEDHGAATLGDALLKQEKLANRGVIDDGLGGSSGAFLCYFVEGATGNSVAGVSPVGDERGKEAGVGSERSVTMHSGTIPRPPPSLALRCPCGRC